MVVEDLNGYRLAFGELDSYGEHTASGHTEGIREV
jgi:hypothetical protein